ncbi:hypothetical protein KI387_027190, partial [Taxus chinensis]
PLRCIPLLLVLLLIWWNFRWWSPRLLIISWWGILWAPLLWNLLNPRWGIWPWCIPLIWGSLFFLVVGLVLTGLRISSLPLSHI